MIVIDSNIFAKLFVEEADSWQARSFFKYCINNNIPLTAPTLFFYEVLQIGVYYNFPVGEIYDLINEYLKFDLNLLELNRQDWLEVEKMTQSWHYKSGFPSLYDSSYHIVAIARDSIFLTADKRHQSKTNQFGSIELLDKWEDIFS